MRYIGVDIGGMSIKAGITDENGHIFAKKTVVTQAHKPSEEIVGDIERLIRGLLEEQGLSLADICGIGLGSPGSVNDAEGVVRYCCNINFADTPVVGILKKNLGFENIRISNDANCAALAETLFGAGNGASNSVTVTLGTGLGTGIVADGRLITGNKSAGAEGGHIQIGIGGAMCGCGKRGHYEAYASASALLRQTETAMKKHPESLLNKVAAEQGFDGKTVFIAAKMGDKVAKRVLDRYIKYIGMGLVSLANLLYPEVFIIGGGISKEGDTLIKPLQGYVARNIYGAEFNPPIRVVAATLGNDAGIIGAAALTMKD